MKRTPTLLALLCFGCSPSIDVAASAVVHCTTDADCPNAWLCVDAERCVASELIDRVGPALLVPQNGAVLEQGAVQLIWSPVQGATTYTVHIATDPQLTNVVFEGAPETPNDVTLTYALGPGTYYWRVTSDVTLDAAVETLGMFGVLDDGLYVRCDATCDGDAPELGTRALPYRSINRAIRQAVIADVPNVRVAMRPSGIAYDEQVTLFDGVSLQGNYDASFAETTGRTRIALEGRVMRAANIEEGLTVRGFELENLATEGDSLVLQTYQCGAGLVFEDVSIVAPSLRTRLVTVEQSLGEGPRFVSTTIEGTRDPRSPQVALMSVPEDSAVQLENTWLRGHAGVGVNGHRFRGIDAAGTDIRFSGGGIAIDGGYEVVGISGLASRSGAISVTDSDIELRDVAFIAIGIDTQYGDTLAVTRTSLRIRAGDNARGIHFAAEACLPASHVLTVASSVIEVVATAGKVTTIAIDAECAAGSIVGNTIAVHAATSREVGIASFRSYLRVINNLVLSATHTCAGTCRAGFVEDGGISGQPLAFVNNLFVGYSGDFPYKVATNFDLSDGVSCLNNLNDGRAGSVFQPTASGNAAQPTLTSLLGYGSPGESLKPTDNTELAGFGPPTALCKAAYDPMNAQAQTVSAFAEAVPCYVNPRDRDNVERPAMPTIGAYEP